MEGFLGMMENEFDGYEERSSISSGLRIRTMIEDSIFKSSNRTSKFGSSA